MIENLDKDMISCKPSDSDLQFTIKEVLARQISILEILKENIIH